MKKTIIVNSQTDTAMAIYPFLYDVKDGAIIKFEGIKYQVIEQSDYLDKQEIKRTIIVTLESYLNSKCNGKEKERHRSKQTFQFRGRK